MPKCRYDGMVQVVRGTTPALPLTIDTDLTDGWNVYGTFEWPGGGPLVKAAESVTKTTVTVKLTQAETLAFPEGAIVDVQVVGERAGEVVKTEWCETARFVAGKALYEGTFPLEA